MNNETKSEKKNTEPNYKIRRGLAKTALMVMFIAGAYTGLNYIDNDGSRSPEKFGEINPTINEIYIEEGANFRHDPVVEDNDGGNVIETIEQPLNIEDLSGKIRVRDDKINGDWYGIPIEDIKKVNPDFKDRGDNDDIAWVNTQKADITSSTEENFQE